MALCSGDTNSLDHGVATPLEVYQGLVAEGYQLSYRRLPLSRERTPVAADLDALNTQLMVQPEGESLDSRSLLDLNPLASMLLGSEMQIKGACETSLNGASGPCKVLQPLCSALQGFFTPWWHMYSCNASKHLTAWPDDVYADDRFVPSHNFM